MRLIQNKPHADDVTDPPANDNTPAPEDFSILDHISIDDDEVAGAIRRTERLALAVVIGMAICLVVVPLVFAGLMYGI
ncbi:hypothetical protein MesoLj131a_56940 [Mesorhizobium sp. 131-2-1]|nr:hypothetical protein MesoLj131a_56940 [Mesorhizobium sp. 131-2-1]